MVDPSLTCLFIPPELKKFKRDLFERIGRHIVGLGGRTQAGNHEQLDRLPDDIIPIVGCSPYLRPLVLKWRREGRQHIYWDRGYCRRVFATHLPRGADGGYYRWHLNSFQLQSLRDVPGDRWKSMQTPLQPWKKDGRHIVVALPTPTYTLFHGTEDWTENTLTRLRSLTGRKIVTRDKQSSRPLQDDLAGAHCLVAHASNAAVEAAIMGCPVFVHPDSAAALIGLTDLNEIENPIYPDRQQWANSLAYSQFNEKELCDGTLWRLIG